MSNKNRVLLSGVGEQFLDQNISYHCPIYCDYNFDKVKTRLLTRHIYLYNRGEYQTLTHDLTGTDWNSLKYNNVDVYAQNVTDRIQYLVNKHIPNKQMCIRISDPPWLSNNIKRLMRKGKRLYDRFKRSKTSLTLININK